MILSDVKKIYKPIGYNEIWNWDRSSEQEIDDWVAVYSLIPPSDEYTCVGHVAVGNGEWHYPDLSQIFKLMLNPYWQIPETKSRHREYHPARFPETKSRLRLKILNLGIYNYYSLDFVSGNCAG